MHVDICKYAHFMSIFLFPLFFSFRPYAAQYLYIPNKVQTNENLNRFFFLFQSQQQTNKKKAHESSIEFEGRKTCMSRRKNREREKLFFFVFMSMAHFNSFAKKATTRMYIQGNRRRNKKKLCRRPSSCLLSFLLFSYTGCIEFLVVKSRESKRK